MKDPFEREVAVFGEARRLPWAERAAYLDEACGGDKGLRQRVEDLLRAGEEAQGFLQEPAPGAQRPDGPPVAATLVLGAAAPGEKAGDRIGRYKLLQQIGEGGCGVVYMAEQEEPVRRRVALKVIKLGMDTKSVIARFEAERQALAMMDHPNIAKVLDAGATETGRPYFVMELVRGIKITDYCDEHHLSTKERLELFIQVCHAVQHAHQKGIIHRDLKPSNILVASDDGVPVPKVIDFGIAKATQGRLTDQTLFTAFEQFIGTPAYMSPEQAELTMQDVDTRTDIYSLGVLLYELLTGKTPFDAQELLASGLDVMRRTIREQEPQRPSTRLSTMLVEELTTTAKHRHTDSAKLIHSLRGDLDWIVMKCLEKDRARRYDTSNGLANDVRRHLNCEPVVARPPSRLYEFQKTVLRHKFGFAAAAALIAVMAAGVVVSTLEAIRATRAEREQRRQRQQAEASQKQSQMEAAKATAVSDFLQELLSSANPYALKGSEYTVRQLLDDFSAGRGAQLTGQPEVEAAVRATIGNAYRQLGLPEKAAPHLQRALELRRRISGEQSQEFAQSLVDHAWNLCEQARWPEAEAETQRALAIYRGGGADAQPLIHASYVLAVIMNLQKRFKDAETISEQALALARNSPNREFPDMANLLHNLADTKVSRGNYVEAEKLALQAGEMHRRLRGAEHPERAWSLMILGRALAGQHKLADAERAYQEAFAIFRRYYPFEHNTVQLAVLELKAVLEARGDSAAIEALSRERFADANKRISRNRQDTEGWVQRGLIETDLNGWKAASQDFGEALMLCKDQNPSKRKAVGEACLQFVDRAAHAGQPEIAEGVAGEAVALFKRLAQEEPEDSQVPLNVAAALSSFSFLLREEGRLPEAVSTAREALDIRKKLLGNEHAEVAGTLHLLAWNLHLQGKNDEASAYSGEEVRIRRKLFGNEDFSLAWALGDLAIFLRDQGKLAEAETAIHDSLAIRQKRPGYNLPDAMNPFRLRAELLRKQGKPAEAEPLEREVAARGSVQTLNDLAWDLATSADAKLRDASNAVAYAERANTATSRTNASYLNTLAATYAEAGQFDKAVSVQNEAIALVHKEEERKDYASRLRLYESKIPYRDDAVLATRTKDLLDAGRYADAEPLARECLALRESQIPDDWRAFNARSMLGGALLGQKKYAEETEAMLLTGYAGMKQRENTIPPVGRPRIKETLQRLVQLYEETKRPDQAAEWKQKLAEFDQAPK